MKNRSILFSAVVFMLFSVLVSCKKDDDTPNNASDYDREILALINQHRAKRGLKKLEHNDIVWKYANEHSKNMAGGKVQFGHVGFKTRVQNIGKEMGRNLYGAENVAMNYSDIAQDVLNQWLNSSGHRKNIEGNYKLTGISAVQSKGGAWYYTQIFIP